MSSAGAHRGTPRASAASSPNAHFLGDSAGTVFTFTVTNAGSRPMGAVQIAPPSKFWLVMACPQAPAGWVARADEQGCRYENRAGAAGDIAPGASSSAFQMTAGTRDGASNRTGTFKVSVGSAPKGPPQDRSCEAEDAAAIGGAGALECQSYPAADPNAFHDDDDKGLTKAPAAYAGGLDVTAFSFQVLDVVVTTSPAAPGSPCPPANKTATRGSIRALVVCGKNRTDQTLTPTSSFSSLGGSFLESAGIFGSAPIAGGNSSSVVLGSWDDARTTTATGKGNMIVASVGSSADQTSPPIALADYELADDQVRNAPPAATPQDVGTKEDTPVAITLAGADPDGDPFTLTVASVPRHGTLSVSAPNVTYRPDADYFGRDSFTFRASDGKATSAPRTVDITVDPVNDSPRFTGGPDAAVAAAAGPQHVPAWATGISAGPANESSQSLTFVLAGNNNPRLFADPPAVSPTGTLTFTPDAASIGSSTITLTLEDDGGTANGGIDASPPLTFVVSVRGPTLIARSPARVPSGPPGGGLELAGSGYGECRQVYFFFDGNRIGSARPDRAGRVRRAGFAVPGDAEPGRHVVETSCRSSGNPVQVRTNFDVTPASLHRSVVMTSLPKPGDVDLSAKSVAASMAGAVALILLVAFPGGLLDSTLDEHYEEVRGWFGRRARTRRVARQPRTALRLLGLIGFLAVGGLAGSFLDPRFGFTRSTLALAIGLSVSLGVVFLGFELPGVTYRRTRHREWGRVVLRPGALMLTAVLVGASRLLHLQPGYLFGLIGGLAFSSELHRKAEGRLSVASALFILAVALAAWFLWVPVSDAATMSDPTLWLVAAEAALGGVFIAGLESLVVGLLPLREMDGSTIKAWSRLDWVLVYGLAAFGYVLIVLRPAAASGADPQGQMGKALVVAGIFAVCSIIFWAYFRFRSDSRGDSAAEAHTGGRRD